jgi:hypothetical protein
LQVVMVVWEVTSIFFPQMMWKKYKVQLIKNK